MIVFLDIFNVTYAMSKCAIRMRPALHDVMCKCCSQAETLGWPQGNQGMTFRVQHVCHTVTQCVMLNGTRASVLIGNFMHVIVLMSANVLADSLHCIQYNG